MIGILGLIIKICLIICMYVYWNGDRIIRSYRSEKIEKISAHFYVGASVVFFTAITFLLVRFFNNSPSFEKMESITNIFFSISCVIYSILFISTNKEYFEKAEKFFKEKKLEEKNKRV